MEVTLQQLVAQGHPEAQRQSFFLDTINTIFISENTQPRENCLLYASRPNALCPGVL